MWPWWDMGGSSERGNKGEEDKADEDDEDL